MNCGPCRILPLLLLLATVVLIAIKSERHASSMAMETFGATHEQAVVLQDDAPAGEQATQNETAESEEEASDNQVDRTHNPDPDLYVRAESLPDWALTGTRVELDSQTEYIVVVSDPLLQQRESQADLEERLVATVNRKVDEMFSPGAADAIGIDLDYIRNNLLVPGHEYCQELYWSPTTGVEPAGIEDAQGENDLRTAYRCVAQLKLDPEFHKWATVTWREQQVRSRQMQIGLVFLAGVLMLLLAFGYFKANEKTQGFYSGRLQTIALVGLLAIIGAAIAMSKMFPWL
ncbi:MAG: hypothetical protein ACR2NP_07520 [Pirellulaceae bacterium]